MAVANGATSVWGPRPTPWSARTDVMQNVYDRLPDRPTAEDIALRRIRNLGFRDIPILPKNISHVKTPNLAQAFLPLSKEGNFVEHRALSRKSIKFFDDLVVNVMQHPQVEGYCLVAHDMGTKQVVWVREMGKKSFQVSDKGIVLVDPNEQDIEIIDQTNTVIHKVKLPFPLNNEVHITKDGFCFYDAEDREMVGGKIVGNTFELVFKEEISWDRDDAISTVNALKNATIEPFGESVLVHIRMNSSHNRVFFDQKGNSFSLKTRYGYKPAYPILRDMQYRKGLVYTLSEIEAQPIDGKDLVYKIEVHEEKKFIDSQGKSQGKSQGRSKGDSGMILKTKDFVEILAVSDNPNVIFLTVGFIDTREFRVDMATQAVRQIHYGSLGARTSYVDREGEATYAIAPRNLDESVEKVYRWAKGRNEIIGTIKPRAKLAHVDQSGAMHILMGVL